jgi:hypothetical protein
MLLGDHRWSLQTKPNVRTVITAGTHRYQLLPLCMRSVVFHFILS